MRLSKLNLERAPNLARQVLAEVLIFLDISRPDDRSIAPVDPHSGVVDIDLLRLPCAPPELKLIPAILDRHRFEYFDDVGFLHSSASGGFR